MATQPTPQGLPLFYKDLVPLNSNEHGKFKSRQIDSADFMADQHAIPLTIEEFVSAARHFPIIFSAGDAPVPLALMGMNEGVNVFMDDAGKFTQPVYLPAYIRRYPFMLARLRPDSDELTLCFDPTSKALGEFKKEGESLFDGTDATETTKNILKFCEDFEQAGARTQAFVDELKKLDLLMDGEVAIQQEGKESPYVYRGFQMVNEEKLRDMRGDELRKMNQNGMLPLIYAHLFSLNLVRDVFAMQVQQGKVPQGAEPALA
ncbi:MAG: SapC family protein [Sphingorhabdus sp.]